MSLRWVFLKSGKLKKSELGDYEIPFIPEGESAILVTVEVDYATLMFQDLFGLISLEQTSTRRPRFVPLVVHE